MLIILDEVVKLTMASVFFLPNQFPLKVAQSKSAFYASQNRECNNASQIENVTGNPKKAWKTSRT